jgi:hypothetical protein
VSNVRRVYHRYSLLLFCTTSLVTRTAVSVVICLGPSLRPSKPFFLNSEVLSIIRQCCRFYTYYGTHLVVGHHLIKSALGSFFFFQFTLFTCETNLEYHRKGTHQTCPHPPGIAHSLLTDQASKLLTYH